MRSVNASKVDEHSCQLRRVGPELRFAHSNCTLEQGLGLNMTVPHPPYAATDTCVQ
jgi:hypothetical protein